MTRHDLSLRLLAVLALGLTGCGQQAAKCAQDADCSTGSICQSGACEALVLTDAGGSDAGGSDAGGSDAGGGEPCSPGSVCRATAGDCDVEEECPASGVCPGDALIAAEVICRAPVGQCDVAERCDGVSSACPADALSGSSTVCRAPAGPCDAEERCSGNDAACPPDLLSPSSTVCRASAGQCDLEEACDGLTSGCPADGFVSASTSCRAAAGICDVEEVCSGSSAACPADARRAPGFACRPAGSVCDAAEVCDGAGVTCPADQVQPSTMQCASQSCTAGIITPARLCAGSSATCSPSAAPIPCNGYQCAGDTCRSSCQTTADCVSTHFCQPGNLCAPRRVDGQLCSSATAGEECMSGSCTATYVDNDGDTFGAGTATFVCGTAAPSGRSLSNTDCCDSDSRAFLGATGYQTTERVVCGGYDFNCDGAQTLQFVQTNPCTSTACGVACSGNPGWAGATPACGAVATYVTNCASLLCLPGTNTRCAPITEQRAQSCR